MIDPEKPNDFTFSSNPPGICKGQIMRSMLYQLFANMISIKHEAVHLTLDWLLQQRKTVSLCHSTSGGIVAKFCFYYQMNNNILFS